MIRTIILFGACLVGMLSPAGAFAADWSFVGSWKMNVTCFDRKQINNLSIAEATAKRVLGTTNVGDGFGKIVSGHFAGVNVSFSNKYKLDMNGRTFTEVWTGKLSRNGTYFKGAFTTDNTVAKGCSFRGSKL